MMNFASQSFLLWKFMLLSFRTKMKRIHYFKTFASLEIIEINQEIADQAIIYRKNKSKKIKLPDAIILASAKYVNADLLSDDFQNIDSTVIVKNIDDLKI
jgi:predicted nucleic acid-binding protein